MYSFVGGRSNLVECPSASVSSISVLRMTTHALFRLPALSILLTPALLHAAEAVPAPTWHAQSLGQALLYMLLFAGVGIVAAIAGYKIFDKCTPGHLNTEILEHRNVAAAIIAAAVILGVCIIIAASMLG
jgi:putative membrane protein